MKRILIIEPNWLGDILFTTPAIKAIRDKNPGSFIGCIVHPRCKDLLEDNPNINKLILFDEKGRHKSLFSKALFTVNLRKFGFDTVISFHRSMSRMLIAYLSGIRQRIGYYTRKRSWLLTNPVMPPEGLIHRVEYFLDITRSIGIDTDNRDYQFDIPEACLDKARSILEEAGVSADDEFIVINPGGNWLAKRWPAANYARLCRELNRLYSAKILLTGSADDKVLSEEIIRMSNGSAAGICGSTTLKQLASIMRKAKVVIANDSGPMHIAVSQKAPTVAIFGPTSPKVTGPYGSGRYAALHKWYDCDIPCYAVCSNYRCMEAVSVGDVIEAVKGIIQE